MSAPVDLLGDLDRAIAGMEDPVRERRERLGYRDRLIDVRAAVAELVEAAQQFPQEPNPYTYRVAHARLRAALARFGGVK